MGIKEIQDGRGKHMLKIQDENKKRVKMFFDDNPTATQKDCCDAIGLSHVTVNKHLKALGYK